MLHFKNQTNKHCNLWELPSFKSCRCIWNITPSSCLIIGFQVTAPRVIFFLQCQILWHWTGSFWICSRCERTPNTQENFVEKKNCVLTLVFHSISINYSFMIIFPLHWLFVFMWVTLNFISRYREWRKWRTIDPLAKYLDDMGLLRLWVDEFNTFTLVFKASQNYLNKRVSVVMCFLFGWFVVFLFVLFFWRVALMS